MNADGRITKALIWAHARLTQCERTERTSRSQRSRDWAYGESVAIRALIDILVPKASK